MSVLQPYWLQFDEVGSLHAVVDTTLRKQGPGSRLAAGTNRNQSTRMR